MKKQHRLYTESGALTLRRVFLAMVYAGLLSFCILWHNTVLNLAVIVISVLVLCDIIKLHMSLFVKFSAGQNNDFEGIAGRKLYIPVSYRNYTPFCFPVCRFDVYDSSNNVADSPVFSVEPFGKHTVYVEIEPQYSGLYTVGLNKITVWDIFGFLRFRRRSKLSACSLTVLPEIIKDRFPGLPKDEKPEDEDYQFRNYIDGDNLRLVNWKKSAGNEELIVKEIIENRHPYDILLYYNSEPAEDPGFRDTLASCAATVAELLSYRHMELRMYFSSPSSGVSGPFGTENKLHGIMRAIAAAEFVSAVPEITPDAENADSVYIIVPGIPADLDKIINSPFLRDRNIYVFSLTDDTKPVVIPEKYSYVIPLRYTLLRRGGADNG